jgi:hypothetical protein
VATWYSSRVVSVDLPPYFVTAVRTKLDGDLKPVSAKSLTVAVRCYESRIGRLGTFHTRCLAEQTQVLWTPTLTGAEPSTSSTPSDSQNADLGDSEHTFRITLPNNIGGLSTVNYPDYKVYWRVEAGPLRSGQLY